MYICIVHGDNEQENQQKKFKIISSFPELCIYLYKFKKKKVLPRFLDPPRFWGFSFYGFKGNGSVTLSQVTKKINDMK